MKYKVILLLILSILLSSLAYAQDQVMINSDDWKDVYSGVLYAKLIGVKSSFIVEETHGIELLDIVDRDLVNVILIESEKKPFVAGFGGSLLEKGFSVKKILSTESNNINLDLAKELKLKDYIIIDSSYGYNAISVAGYAVLTNSYVLLVDTDNYDDVYSFLTDINPNSLILYGKISKTIKSRFESFNPTIIDNGNKYDDNVEIVRRFLSLKESDQIVITSGDFVEDQVMAGDEPVLFIGSTNVPDQAIEFVKNEDSEFMILVGNELVQNAKTLREQAGKEDVKILIKFAQGRNEIKKALDLFYLPKYESKIRIKAVRYNIITRELEVIYENSGNSFAYIKATHGVYSDEELIQRVGDEKSQFLDAGETIAIPYKIDLLDFIYGDYLKVKTNIIYGGSIGALDHLLQQENDLNTVDVEDNTQVSIENVVYNKNIKRFIITVKNIGANKVYVDPSVKDIMLDGDITTLSFPGIDSLEKGESKEFKIKTELIDIDYEDNPQITVSVKYGKNKDVLLKEVEKEFDLVTVGINWKLIIMVAIIIIVFFLILFTVFNRRKDDNLNYVEKESIFSKIKRFFRRRGGSGGDIFKGTNFN